MENGYSFFLDHMMIKNAEEEVFSKLIDSGEIPYKVYKAYYYISMNEWLDGRYHPRKLKWAKRYMRKHGYSYEYYCSLVAEKVKENQKFYDIAMGVFRRVMPESLSRFM